MLRLMIIMLFCVLFVGCAGEDLPGDADVASGDGGSASIRLTWDPPADPNGNPQQQVAGYYLYYGPDSGVYNVSIDVGFHTSLTVSDLQTNQPYYFAVTAYDEWDNESDFSHEVCVIPLPDGLQFCDG